MRVEEILQEKWSDKYKKSINCSNPKGFSQKAHCAGRKKTSVAEENKDYMHGYCHEWALMDVKKNPERVLYARTGFHYDDEYEEVDHVFTVDPKTGKAYDVRGEFANADALLADHDFGADEIDVEQIDVQNIKNWIADGELKKISINEAVDQKAEIYVDMDGVLADFFGVWTKMVGVKNWKEVKDVDSALDMIRSQKDFWINLPLTSNATKLLNSIKKVKGNYTILSSPLPDDPNSEPQKREWVKKMLSGFAPKRVIITHNKSAYAKQPDGTPNILIDDYGDNIRKWESAGGIGIQHSDKNADATVSKLEEGDFVTDISRFMNRAIRPGFYQRAAKAFHEWLKDQEPYRHSLGFYAMQWGNRYKNMDWRNLKQAYEVMFGDDVLVESKEPKLVKDKKQKNLKSMDKPTKYERRKNYQNAEEDKKDSNAGLITTTNTK